MLAESRRDGITRPEGDDRAAIQYECRKVPPPLPADQQFSDKRCAAAKGKTGRIKLITITAVTSRGRAGTSPTTAARSHPAATSRIGEIRKRQVRGGKSERRARQRVVLEGRVKNRTRADAVLVLRRTRQAARPRYSRFQYGPRDGRCAPRAPWVVAFTNARFPRQADVAFAGAARPEEDQVPGAQRARLPAADGGRRIAGRRRAAVSRDLMDQLTSPEQSRPNAGAPTK